jgi:hypothetical protein
MVDHVILQAVRDGASNLENSSEVETAIALSKVEQQKSPNTNDSKELLTGMTTNTTPIVTEITSAALPPTSDSFPTPSSKSIPDEMQLSA